MTIREVVYVPDMRLRQKANTIKDFTPDIKQLVEDLLETMRCHEGVGLAGPQIGIMQRIFVAQIPVPTAEDAEPHPQSGIPFALLNPEIIRTSQTLIEGQEGCLSIPGWVGLVNRPEWVEVRAQDVKGRSQKLKAEGFLARIFLHELDHLNGILYTDHILTKDNLWQIDDQDDEDGVHAANDVSVDK